MLADMTATKFGPTQTRLWTSALASPIPWAAFLGATVVADVWIERTSISYGGLVTSSPFYLGFVALPSLFPLAVARRGTMWLAVLAAMTGVSALAGVLVVTTDDAQAGLAVLWVPFVAVPLAGVIWIGEAVAARRRAAAGSRDAEPGSPAGLSNRLAALTIDAVVLGVALVGPLTSMSHAKHEVAAAVVGIGTATVYQAGLAAWRGGTIGQSLLGLAVVDAATGGRVTLTRLLARGVIVTLEVAAAFTIVLAPVAIAELAAAGGSGRSLTDRLLRTEIVSTARAAART